MKTVSPLPSPKTFDKQALPYALKLFLHTFSFKKKYAPALAVSGFTHYNKYREIKKTRILP